MIAQLVILLRLWRIVRVVNGIILSSKSQNDGALHQAKGEARKVIHMLHKTQKRLTEEIVSSHRPAALDRRITNLADSALSIQVHSFILSVKRPGWFYIITC